MDVLAFMFLWQQALRTGAGPHGQPEYYPLPEQGETENDRAALKLLRACREDNYWGAEQLILALLKAPQECQLPIFVRMQAIVDAAKLAAFRAAFPGGGPAAGPPASVESPPAGLQTTEASAEGSAGQAPQAEQAQCTVRDPGEADGSPQREAPRIEPAPAASVPQPEAREERQAHNPPRTEAAEKPSRAQRALAVILANPGWSKGQIAKGIGISRSTLDRWENEEPVIKAALESRLGNRQDAPRGFKDKEGNLEAWDDPA
jgi:hypothetical protein